MTAIAEPPGRAGRLEIGRRGSGRQAAAGRIVGLAVIAATAVACGGDARPTVAEWLPQWEAVVAEAPAAEAAGELDRSVCERLLVAARQAEPELLPTPDEALDGPVQEWLDDAETIGFECESHGDLDHGLAELQILQAEVEAGLGALG